MIGRKIGNVALIRKHIDDMGQVLIGLIFSFVIVLDILRIYVHKY